MTMCSAWRRGMASLAAFLAFLLLISDVGSFVLTSTTSGKRVVGININNNDKSFARFASSTSSTSSTTKKQNRKNKSSQKSQNNKSFGINNNISYGDTRGAAALIQGVSVSRGPNQILTDIDWRVEPKSKWALVGANGAGKSTLLKAFMGELLTDDGSITIGTTQQVGYLQQTAVSGSTKTVYEEAASAMTVIEEARINLEKIAAEVAELDTPDEASLQRLEAATEKFEAVGGYTQEREVTSVLKGLGFHNMDTRCDELSGGWQMRVALARLLLSKPSLLLLDEPSNHLDVNARTWLANYLKDYEEGAMVLVTHDVGLLSCSQHIAEVQSGRLQTYKSCTYEQYMAEKEFRAQAAETEYEKNKEKAAQLQGFVDKWGASATKASAAQSRVKQIEKMEKAGLLDAPPEAVMGQRFKPTLRLPDPPQSVGETLVALEGASIGHEDKVLVSDVNLDVTRGMKLFLRGPNGVGKSTLLHSLRGTLELLDGERKTNPQLALGVFTQDLAQELDANTRAVDLVTAYAREIDPTISDKDARAVMGALGLKGDTALRDIQNLSGGEKARVALSMFGMRPSNLILLDEPSNHLDVECIEALGEALSGWGEEDGAVVVISHDKEFCRHMDFTHVGTVENGKLRVQERGWNDADWNLFEGASSTIASSGLLAQKDTATGDEATEVKEQKVMDHKLRKKIYNAPKRIAKIETLIEGHEEEVAELDASMMEHGSDVEKLMELSDKKTAVEDKIAELMTEWEELEELVATAES